MSDFPTDQLPLGITTLSSYAPYLRQTVATNITWVANRAIYIPVAIPWEYPVNRVFWTNGGTITTSNADFGIYTPSGTKVYSTGSTALSGTSTTQFVTPSTPFVLSAGQYYFAYACDNTTSRSFGNTLGTAATGAMLGYLSQATAFPLPATATFATYGTPGFELCGITRTTSGF